MRAPLRGSASPEVWDLLGYWCAERGSGDWSDFREAAAELGIRASAAARAFTRLGVFEIDWRRRRFSACPPALVALPGYPEFSALMGALGADIEARLEASVADVSWLYLDQRHLGPDIRVIDAHPRERDRLAGELASPVVAGAAQAVAARLSTIDRARCWVPDIPDDRLVPELCYAGTTIPDPTARDRRPSGPGVYLFAGYDRREAWVHLGGGNWRRCPEREYAPYLAPRPAEAEPLIEWDPVEEALRCAPGAPLPTLAARAAVLCTGLLPRLVYDPERPGLDPAAIGPAEVYRNVPAEVAHAIADHLGHSLPANEES
jgi:hypothetical protein